MKKINVYICFEDEVCNIGSQVDGQSLYDLIYFDKRKDDTYALYLDTVPRIGETVELRSSAGSHCFTVLAVHNSIHANRNETQYVKILLKQMKLSEFNEAWFFY